MLVPVQSDPGLHNKTWGLMGGGDRGSATVRRTSTRAAANIVTNSNYIRGGQHYFPPLRPPHTVDGGVNPLGRAGSSRSVNLHRRPGNNGGVDPCQSTRGSGGIDSLRDAESAGSGCIDPTGIESCRGGDINPLKGTCSAEDGGVKLHGGTGDGDMKPNREAGGGSIDPLGGAASDGGRPSGSDRPEPAFSLSRSRREDVMT